MDELEAAIGFEPTYTGFAGLRMTTLPRRSIDVAASGPYGCSRVPCSFITPAPFLAEQGRGTGAGNWSECRAPPPVPLLPKQALF